MIKLKYTTYVKILVIVVIKIKKCRKKLPIRTVEKSLLSGEF